MGEFKVHRVRFFDFMPSGIRCMAFNSKADRLALARLDGSVEIFNFSNNYFQEKVIPGNDSRSIEAICWVGCDRLFTAGLNGEVVEYDLERLCPKYTLDAFGGPIWTAACNSEETHFASGMLIAAGSLDVIRVFDVKSGHSVQRILVDRGPAGTRNKDCVVWNVAFLSDYTIVSGDSAGKVQLWDANKGTLIKTHLVSKWDVLSLSVSEFGCEDGSVKLFEILPDKIQFERNLDRQKGRILSLSWHKSGTLIAAGSLDVIRVFDVKSGHSVQRILVDRGPAGTRNKDCVVWNVAFLSDYTIVSGDSAGKVQLWDANKGTLIKTHLVSKWDVLSLSVSENEDSIVAGTSEGMVVQFQLLSPKIGDTETQWVRTRTFKHHTHDVRAVTETRTAVVSGGRILSLSWHKSGTLIAAGSLDVIRVFDVKSGHSVQRILVDRGPAGTRNKDCVVWNVAFLSDYTIVSGDSAGKVQLWDANKGTLIKTHLVSKWDVLSLSVSENEDSIVAGTSEGMVVQFQLLSPKIGDTETQWVRTRTFKHHTHDVRAVTETRTAVVSGGRILSLSWHKSGTLIAAGSLDVIRVFDVKSGHSVQRILVDRGPAGTRNKDCVVWNVAFLSDYTIVSGDSAGKVQLWDANKGTLIKTHLVSKWDVLSLSVSENEDSIVAGTSEGMVVQFQLLSPKIGDTETQWVRTRTFKHHTHDVRAVTETRTAVVSGGLDAQLVICPLMDRVEVKSSESVLRKVIFPHRSLVSCAKKPSLLLFQFPDQLELWRLGGTDTIGKPGESLPVTRKPEKLLQLKRKGDDHICCSTISECGHWIAYATVSSIRLYQLQCDNNNISITKVSKLPKVLRSAHQLQFSADSSKLFVASEQATIHVIGVSRSECKHVHTFKPKSGSSAPVHLLAVSADGQWLTSANRHCEINVYNLKKLKHHCMVPVYNSLPSAMAIHPETNNLLVTHADQQMFEFGIVDKQYTDWSRKLQKEGLHRCRLKWGTPITHITFNPQAPSQVMLHDTHMFCIIDQSLPLDGLKAQFYSQLTPKNTSETDKPHKNNALKICNKYQSIEVAILTNPSSCFFSYFTWNGKLAQLHPDGNGSFQVGIVVAIRASQNDYSDKR
ncbi:UNVERIFIED_CONTAM: hypothetical protein FKN15_070697 [Acipenser sinensis]